jgi:polysaccharide biosynthesis protein PslG
MRVHRQRTWAARRRWPIALLMTILVSVVLSACGGGSSPTATPPETSVPTASASTTSASATSATTTSAATTQQTASAASSTAASTGTPATGPISTTFPMKYPHISYGMNVWLPTADMDKTLNLLTGAGFNWARQWFSWESVEPTKGVYSWDTLDKVVNAANQHNVKLMLLFVRSPAWAGANGGIPQDKQTFATFMGAVAARYKGKVAAYEIWNEENLASETGGHVDPTQYVELLKAAFPAIKAADPCAVVVYGGLTPTGVNDPSVAIDDTIYLQQAYAYNNGEVKKYFDVLGCHPGSANNPPEALWPDNPGPGPGYFDNRSFYFRRAEDIRKVMEQAGDGDKQIWLTEFGWTTKNAAKGYEYGQYISEDQQAQYLVAAYQWAKEKWPWVGVMFLWNLNFSTVSPPTDEKTPWSIIYADYSPRPSYDALKKMPK